jgi:hypothetical protein
MLYFCPKQKYKMRSFALRVVSLTHDNGVGNFRTPSEHDNEVGNFPTPSEPHDNEVGK